MKARSKESKERRTAYRKTHLIQRESDAARARAWRKAHPEKEREYYLKHKASSRPEDIEKERARNREWMRIHRPAEWVREWRKSHPEEYKRRCAIYRSGHRARIREINRGWMKKHPECARRAGRRYAVLHLDRREDLAAQRRAKQRGVTVEKVMRSLVFERDRGRCHLCGKKVPARRWHLDHLIPLAKGGAHSYKNVAVSCARCNLKKGVGRLPTQLRLCG